MLINRLLIILLVTAAVSCTKQKTIDGSSVETYKNSVSSIKSNMTERERIQFDLALMSLGLLEMSKDRSKKKRPLIQYQITVSDGKSKDQILALAKGIANSPEKFLPELKNKAPLAIKSYKPIDWSAAERSISDVKHAVVSRNENPKNIKRLIDSLNHPYHQDWSANDKLYAAVSWGSYIHIDKFLSQGADINGKNNSHGSSPIVQTVLNNETNEILMYLLDKGANPDGTDKYGNTALIRAIGQKNYIAVKILIDKGADINKKGSVGVTPIYCAADRGDAAMVVKLMELGADINIPSRGGFTPLLKMIAMGYNDAAKLLIQNGAQLDNGRIGALEYAKRANNLDMVEFIQKI